MNGKKNVIVKSVNCLDKVQKGRCRHKEEIDVCGCQGGMEEITSRTVGILNNGFFDMKEIDTDRYKKKYKKKNQGQAKVFSF